MDRIEAMSLVLAVADAGSLSAASRRLGLPLATVSRKIADLEAHLKTRIFQRMPRQIVLTDAGRAYAEACRRIVDEVEEAERTATGEYATPRGALALTAPIVFGRLHVLPVVLGFLEDYPEIAVRMVLSDHTLDLTEGNIDLAVRIGALSDSSLIATRVGATRRVVCGSPAYLATRGRPMSLSELARHDWVTSENLAAPRAWTFRRGKAEKIVPLRSRLTVTTAEAAIDAAIAGTGLTRVLSYMVADAVKRGALKIVLEQFEPAPWPVHIVYRASSLLPQKLRAFVDWAAPRLRSRLG